MRLLDTYMGHMFVPVALLGAAVADYSVVEVSGYRGHASVTDKGSPVHAAATAAGLNSTHARDSGGSTGSTADAPLPVGWKRVALSLDDAAEPAALALDLATRLCSPLHLLSTTLGVAELRLLQGDTLEALAHWVEARDLLLTLFVNGASMPIVWIASCSVIDRLELLLTRLVCAVCVGYFQSLPMYNTLTPAPRPTPPGSLLVLL